MGRRHFIRFGRALAFELLLIMIPFARGMAFSREETLKYRAAQCDVSRMWTLRSHAPTSAPTPFYRHIGADVLEYGSQTLTKPKQLSAKDVLTEKPGDMSVVYLFGIIPLPAKLAWSSFGEKLLKPLGPLNPFGSPLALVKENRDKPVPAETATMILVDGSYIMNMKPDEMCRLYNYSRASVCYADINQGTGSNDLRHLFCKTVLRQTLAIGRQMTTKNVHEACYVVGEARALYEAGLKAGAGRLGQTTDEDIVLCEEVASTIEDRMKCTEEERCVRQYQDFIGSASACADKNVVYNVPEILCLEYQGFPVPREEAPGFRVSLRDVAKSILN